MSIFSNKKGYSTYREVQANELEQSSLILMMYAGGISFLDKAVEVAETDKVEMGMYVVKAKNVILELMSSLNFEKGKEMGEILLRIYKVLFHKLNVAHMNDDVEKLKEVRWSLSELEDAWKQVFISEDYSKIKNNMKILETGNSIQR